MKITLLLFISGFVLYSSASSDWNSQVQSIGWVQSFIIQGLSAFTIRNCSHSSIEKLKDASNQAIECVKNIKYNSSFCYTFVNHFKPCVQGLLDETGKCETAEKTALKNIILDSVIEEARYICNVDGEHIFEIFNPCALKSVKLSHECRRNITEKMERTEDPAVICSVHPKIQKCFEDQIQHECENELTRTTIHDYLSVNVKPCNIAMNIYLNAAMFLF